MPPRPALLPVVAKFGGGGGGKGIFPLPLPPHDRGVRGEAALLLSLLQTQLTWAPANRASSSMLPRQGTMPALPCTAAGKGQDQLSPLVLEQKVLIPPLS